MSASARSPCESSDKSARAANTIFIHNGAPQVLVGCLDNIFIEGLWRSLKHENIYLKHYTDGREARRNRFLDRKLPENARFTNS